jgi:DNA-binding XRE family transcriptional regulator
MAFTTTERKTAMIRQIVKIKGKRYALVEPTELRRLEKIAALHEELPSYPPADAEGKRPALESATVSIARTIIRQRKAAGLTQEELARRAGVRQETICRLESGKYSPTVRTIDKIDRALQKAANRR